MSRRWSFKQAVILLVLLVLPPVGYLFRASIIDFFVLRPTSPEYEVEVVLIDETPEYNIQFNPLHPQDFKTFFLGYFFTEKVEKVFLHLTDRPQDVLYLRESGNGNVAYMGHSNLLPANGELHVFVYLNRVTLEEMGRSFAAISRSTEARFYDALVIASANIEDESKITSELLNKSDQNLFLVSNE